MTPALSTATSWGPLKCPLSLPDTPDYAQGGDVDQVPVEDLHAVITGVGHVQLAVGAERHAGGAVKLVFPVPHCAAQRAVVRPVGIEDLDAIVPSCRRRRPVRTRRATTSGGQPKWAAHRSIRRRFPARRRSRGGRPGVQLDQPVAFS